MEESVLPNGTYNDSDIELSRLSKVLVCVETQYIVYAKLSTSNQALAAS